jgi:ethanolamine utilization protein EutN
VGEVVFWCRGREASFPFLPSQVPSECTIVGIVDSVFLQKGEKRMLLARVIGNVVATQKDARYEGGRIMVVRTINPDGSDAGDELLALDAVDSGVGDTVVVVREGWSASTTATGTAGAAIDSAIIGIVDTVD